MSEDIYAIVYFNDEIGLRLSSCKNPAMCSCRVTSDTRYMCGYPAAQAKRYIIEYYKRKITYLENQSLEDFMHDQGFYK